MLEDKIRQIIKQQKLEQRLGDKRAEQFWEKIKAAGGDMLKADYDQDADGIVDKAENVDDGAGNASTAVEVKDAVDKKHVQAHAASHSSGQADVVNHDNLAGFVAAEHKSLPNTIAEVLSNHNKAVHDALNINADQVDGEEAADIVTNARVKAHFPDTIANILSNHDKALHEALGLAPVATPTFTGQVTAPTVDLTGGQIAFPAAQNASADPNTLDDYEEGTWAPRVFLGATEVTSYTIQVGSYIKIGSRVFLQCNVTINVVGAGVGSVSMGGFPFVSANVTNDHGAGSAWTDALVGLTVESIQTFNIKGTSLAYIYRFNNGINAALTQDNIGIGSSFVLGVSYHV